MSLATVSRYLPKRPPDRGKQQRWVTFLRNHKDAVSVIRDAPEARAIEARPALDPKVVGLPRAGGLHHRYV